MTEYKSWQEAYAVVADLAQTHGYASAKSGTINGFDVGSWINRQRELVKFNNLSPERTELLSRILGALPQHNISQEWVTHWPALRAELTWHGIDFPVPANAALATLMQQIMESTDDSGIAMRHLCFAAAKHTESATSAHQWAQDLKHAHTNNDEKWLAEAYKAKAAGELSPWQIRALKSLAPTQVTADAKWNTAYNKLFESIVITGEAFPDAQEVFEGEAIGRFATQMRKELRSGWLTDDKAEALLMLPGWSPAVGVSTDRSTRSMARVFLAAMDIGTYPLSLNSAKNWLMDARFKMNGGLLSERQQTLLKATPGFTWLQNTKGTRIYYKMITELIAEEGRLNYTPWTTHEGYGIGIWLANLTESDREKFFAQGVQPHQLAEPMRGDDLWTYMFKQLKEWVTRHDGETPGLDVVEGGVPLGAWYWSVNYFSELGLIPAERQRQLRTALSLTAWMLSLAEVETRYETRTVPLMSASARTWVRQVRRWHSMGIRNEQVSELENVEGFSWTSSKTEKFYSDLQKFRTLVGHLRRNFDKVRQIEMVDGFSPAHFVKKHRNMYLNGTLPGWMHFELDSIVGWNWVTDPISTPRVRTSEFIDLLVQWQGEYGPILPERTVVYENVGLGAWVETVRQQHENGVISGALTAQLETIPGWSWTPTAEHIGAHGVS